MSRALLKRALESMRRTRSIPTGESIDTMRAIEDELTKPDPEPIAYITGWYGGYPTISIIDGAVLPNGTPLYAVPPSIQKRKPLSDEQILNIASNPLITPCSPWWLKDDVAAGDVQNAAKAFARALETAHGITS